MSDERTYHREKAKKVRKMIQIYLKNIEDAMKVTEEQRKEYEAMVDE